MNSPKDESSSKSLLGETKSETSSNPDKPEAGDTADNCAHESFQYHKKSAPVIQPADMKAPLFIKGGDFASMRTCHLSGT